MDKNIDEIEIEEISLDIDDKYEVTLDISPSTDDIIESLKIDQPIAKEEELAEELTIKGAEEEFKEVSSLEGLEAPQEFGFEAQGVEGSQEEENNISLSVEELDSILSEAKVEVTSEDVGLTTSEEESVGFEVEERLSTEVSGVDFSASEEAISFEGEKLSRGGVFEEEGLSTEVSGVDFSASGEAISFEGEKLSQGGVFEEEGLSTEVSGVDFSASGEAISFEGEKLSQGKGVVEDLGDVVVMDSEGYNKVISEELPPIEEKPVEFEEGSVGFEEEFSFGEAVSPEELGIGEEKKEEFELSEFAEITEEMVEEQKLNVVEGEEESKEEAFSGVSEEVSFEISETKEGEIVGEFEEISEIGLGEIGLGVTQEESITKEEVEVVDDISISKGEYGIVEEIPEDIGVGEEVKYSVTPEELGIEEIEITPEVETGSIVGIGFEEEAKEKVEEETRGAEDVISFVEESIGLPEVEEKALSIEERGAKIEEAIEGLSDVEKEALRKVLKYLDKLLESLPEDKVREFASSEYYDLYVRLFDKLNIK
jgi:pilus assembly protein FimV